MVTPARTEIVLPQPRGKYLPKAEEYPPEWRAAAKLLRKALKGLIDFYHFRQEDGDGEPIKVNAANNPLPYRLTTGLRQPDLLSVRRLLAHMAGTRLLHVNSDANAESPLIALDVDNEPPPGEDGVPVVRDALQRLEAHGDSREFAFAVLEGLADDHQMHVVPSRGGAGAHPFMILDCRGFTPLQARGVIEVVAAVMREKHPPRQDGRLKLDGNPLHGLHRLELPNAGFDADLAARKSFVPWPRDEEDREPGVLYGEPSPGERYTEEQRYHHRRERYACRWKPCNLLERAVGTDGPSVVLPGYLRKGRSTHTVVPGVHKLISEIERLKANPVTQEAALAYCGLPSWDLLFAALEPYARGENGGKVDWPSVVVLARGGRAAPRPKKTRGRANHTDDISDRIRQMLESGEKHTAALGAAYLSLHQTGGVADLRLALDLYAEHVPGCGEEDAKRTARVRRQLDRAERSWDQTKRATVNPTCRDGGLVLLPAKVADENGEEIKPFFTADAILAEACAILDVILPDKMFERFHEAEVILDQEGKPWRKGRTTFLREKVGMYLVASQWLKTRNAEGEQAFVFGQKHYTGAIRKIFGVTINSNIAKSCRSLLTTLAQIRFVKCHRFCKPLYDPETGAFSEGEGRSCLYDLVPGAPLLPTFAPFISRVVKDGTALYMPPSLFKEWAAQQQAKPDPATITLSTPHAELADLDDGPDLSGPDIHDLLYPDLSDHDSSDLTDGRGLGRDAHGAGAEETDNMIVATMAGPRKATASTAPGPQLFFRQPSYVTETVAGRSGALIGRPGWSHSWATEDAVLARIRYRQIGLPEKLTMQRA